MRLYEKHRPRTLDDVVGQDKAVAQIRRMIQGGIGGNAVWLSGPSGAGKTTLARIIADSFKGARVMEYRSADELTAGEIEQIDAAYRVNRRGLFSIPTVVIVNEAHGLNARQVRALLGLLEPVPESFVWVFTTTWAGDNWLEDSQIDAGPLKSRCSQVRLTNQGLARAFAERVIAICKEEGLPVPSQDAAVRLANEHKSNCRAMLQAVQDGA